MQIYRAVHNYWHLLRKWAKINPKSTISAVKLSYEASVNHCRLQGWFSPQTLQNSIDTPLLLLADSCCPLRLFLWRRPNNISKHGRDAGQFVSITFSSHLKCFFFSFMEKKNYYKFFLIFLFIDFTSGRNSGFLHLILFSVVFHVINNVIQPDAICQSEAE